MLAVLAHKMIHTEDCDAEYIYEINAQQLYQEVKKLDLPFHSWYQWLTDRFSIIQSDRYNEEKRKCGTVVRITDTTTLKKHTVTTT